MQLFLLSTLVASTAAVYGPAAVEKTAVADYSYGTAVSDPASGVHNTKEETRLGDRTEGSYSTVLPDGRRQIVTYWVDGDSGYNAKVTYEGVAHHPETPVTAQPQVPVLPQAPVLPQYQPHPVLDLSSELGPPPRDAFLRRHQGAFIPDHVEIPRGVAPSIPFADGPFITDSIGNGQRALNNFDFVNNQRRNIDTRANYATDFQYGQADFGAALGGVPSFGQNGQVFGGNRGVDVHTPVFEGLRGGAEVGFGSFLQQNKFGNGASVGGPPFASANGFAARRPIRGYRVRDANNFRRNPSHNLGQNYGYQGF